MKNIANSTTRSLFSILVNLKSRRSAKAEVTRVAGALDPEPRTDLFKTAPGHGLLAVSALALAVLILPVCADAQGYGLLAANVDTQKDHFYLYYLTGTWRQPIPHPLMQYDPRNSANQPQTLTTTAPNYTGSSHIFGVGPGPMVAYNAESSPYRLVAHVNTLYDNENEVFYLTNPPSTSAACTNANGCFDIEQIIGDGAAFTDLTQVAAAMPAAANTRLVGYIDSCAGTDNVFFVGNDQHVHLLTRSASSAFSDEDLTSKANTGITVVGGVLIGHLFQQSEKVFYLGSNGLVNQIWQVAVGMNPRTGCPLPGGWAGTPLDGGEPPINNSPLAGFYDAAANSDSVFYVGKDNNVYEFYYYQTRALPALELVWTWVNIEVTKGVQLPSGMPFSFNTCPITTAPSCWSALAAHVNTTTQPQNLEEIFFVVPGASGGSLVYELTAPSVSYRPPVWTPEGTIAASGSGAGPDFSTPLVPIVIPALHQPSVTSDDVYYMLNDSVAQLSSTPVTSGAGNWTLYNSASRGDVTMYGQ